MTKPQSVIQFR